MVESLITQTTFDATRLIDLIPLIDPLDINLADPTVLTTDIPVLMLPVRLSARFSPDFIQLKVRISPDDIHIDGLTRQLSEREQALGKQFWEAQEAQPSLEWDRLVKACGNTPAALNRAAWIARTTKPGTEAPFAHSVRATALPDSFMVIAWLNGQLVAHAQTAIITSQKLAINPQKEVTDDHKWLTDYDAAVAAGMAVTLTFATPTPQLDLVLAVGVNEMRPPETVVNEVTELLRSHRYWDGLEFLAQGTPTNNTPATSAGWRSDPDPESVRKREFEPPADGDGSNAALLSGVLGLDAVDNPLSGLPGGALQEQAHAGAMIKALWPVTGGEFLEVLMADNVGDGAVSFGVNQFARNHAATHVRARGPLPVIRIGRQPYGVLPVTSLEKWAPHPSDPATLAGFRNRLRTLWSFWEYATRTATRVGPLNEGAPAEGPVQLVASLLGQSPVPNPTGYRAWTVLPPNFCWSVDPILFSDPVAGDLAVGPLDVPYRPLAADIELATDRPATVVVPDVDPEGVTFLQQLLAIASDYDALKTFAAAKLDLLSQLVQHGLLRAFDRDLQVLGNEIIGSIADHVSMATEFKRRMIGDLDVVATPALNFVTMSDLAVNVAAVPPETTLGELIKNDQLLVQFGVAHTPSPEHADAVEGLSILAGLGVDELSLLLSETLDLYANRYDAWVTSLATQRLATLRASQPVGLHLGGYGWLINVRAQQRVAVAEPPEGVEGPVFDVIGDAGAIHAPSIQQAATAAVVRHADLGDLAEGLGEGDTERKFDLTSASTRRALWLLDAVAQGQPLAAALGYRVERALQDLGSADLIEDLRRAHPLLVGESAADLAETNVSIPPHDVIDGIALWREVDTGTQDQRIPAQVLQDLKFSVDAVADLLVVEGVHHVLTGDHARAQATLTSLARGEAPPTDMRSVNAIRKGLTIPVQLGFLVSSGAGGGNGWAADRPRAAVAPAAELIAQQFLPLPDKCVIKVERADGSAVDVKLSDLKLCALDVICNAPALGHIGSLLEHQVLRVAGENANRVLAESAEGSVGWGALTALARRVRTVLTSARPLTADDLTIGERAPDPSSVDVADSAKTVRAELRMQFVALSEAVAPLRKVIDRAPGEPLTAEETQAITQQLAVLERFGIDGSIALANEDLIAVVSRCLPLASAAAAQLDVLDGLGKVDLAPGAPPPPGQEDGAISRVAQIARTALGTAVAIAPLVDLPAELQGGQSAATEDELADWIGELAAVRQGVRSLHSAWLGAETLAAALPTLVGAQLPRKDGESWLGGWNGVAQEWIAPVSARRAWIMQRIGPNGGTARGLVADSWAEEIPVAEDELTGLAVNVNASDARPPQSMLLAVAPDPSVTNWTLGHLVTILLETLELVRFRPAEPPPDMPSRHLLPAIFVPDGIAGTSSFSDLFAKSLSEFVTVDLINAHAKVFTDGG
jgi:hypothetical protein